MIMTYLLSMEMWLVATNWYGKLNWFTIILDHYYLTIFVNLPYILTQFTTIADPASPHSLLCLLNYRIWITMFL